MKTIKKNNNKVTVYTFGTVYKPKIIVYGQWTVLDVRPGKKMQETHRKKRNTQTPLEFHMNLSFYHT